MATIRKREFVNSYLYEVMIRRKAIPFFYISFSDEEEAIEWVKEHEFKYIENPNEYIRRYGTGQKIDSYRYSMRLDREKKRKSD